ncbi:MAG: bifunctional N(6)-L-threonylcarbamoyladenine synthase/serine/threonine protein kinase [Candidatus Woesearchaeota archaeon]
MICLGIESTAHTFGVAVIDGKKIKSNCKKAFVTQDGGMIPVQVAEHHVQICDTILQDALKQANVTIDQVDIISFSQSPGIGHMLRVGAGVAKSLALLHNKPLVGVNHCIAHLEIGRLLTKAKDPILVYASGANTQIIAYVQGRYRIFGETLDIGIGNFLDSFARHVGLGFPGGPKIAQLAQKSKTYIALPYVVKGMDVSFGGLLTNVKQKWDSGKYPLEDLCYSIQETIFAMLTEVSERALAHCQKNEIVLGGGVACNTRLQEMMQQMCEPRGAKSFALENQYNVDNAAMIAHLGLLMYQAGHQTPVEKAFIDPYLRTDEVEVNWR